MSEAVIKRRKPMGYFFSYQYDLDKSHTDYNLVSYKKKNGDVFLVEHWSKSRDPSCLLQAETTPDKIFNGSCKVYNEREKLTEKGIKKDGKWCGHYKYFSEGRLQAEGMKENDMWNGAYTRYIDTTYKIMYYTVDGPVWGHDGQHGYIREKGIKVNDQWDGPYKKYSIEGILQFDGYRKGDVYSHAETEEKTLNGYKSQKNDFSLNLSPGYLMKQLKTLGAEITDSATKFSKKFLDYTR